MPQHTVGGVWGGLLVGGWFDEHDRKEGGKKELVM